MVMDGDDVFATLWNEWLNAKDANPNLNGYASMNIDDLQHAHIALLKEMME